jgi:hypothetical protein
MPLYGGPGSSPAMNASSNQQATVQHKNPHDKFLASGILIIFTPEQHRHSQQGRGHRIGHQNCANPLKNGGRTQGADGHRRFAVPRNMAEV